MVCTWTFHCHIIELCLSTVNTLSSTIFILLQESLYKTGAWYRKRDKKHENGLIMSWFVC